MSPDRRWLAWLSGLVGSIVIVCGASRTLQAAGEIVKGQITIEIDGKTYKTPEAACRAYLRQHDSSYSFQQAVPRTTTDVVQWECEYKDGDRVSTYGTAEAVLKCPEHSNPHSPWSTEIPNCECESYYRASGGSCIPQAETPIAVAAEATPPSSSPPKKSSVRVNAGGEGEWAGWVDLNPCGQMSVKTAAQIRAANPTGSLIQAGLEDIAKHFAPASVSELKTRKLPSQVLGRHAAVIARDVKLVLQPKGTAEISTVSNIFTGSTKTIFEKEGWKVMGPTRAVYSKP